MERLLRKSDEICKRHISGFVGQDAANRLFLGAAQQSLTLAASLGGPAAAAMAASGSGVQLFNTLLKQVVYADVFAPIVAIQIRNQQIEFAKHVDLHMRQDINEYPVDRAIREVQQYHTLCSFYLGVAGVADTVAKGTPTTTSIPSVTSTSVTSTSVTSSSVSTSTTTSSTVSQG